MRILLESLGSWLRVICGGRWRQCVSLFPQKIPVYELFADNSGYVGIDTHELGEEEYVYDCGYDEAWEVIGPRIRK